MASLIDIVKDGRIAQKSGLLSEEEMGILASKEAELSQAVSLGRQAFEQDTDNFSFDDYKRLKDAESVLGVPQEFGLAQSIEAIGKATPEQLGQATARAAGSAIRGTPKAVLSAGKGLLDIAGGIAKGAVQAAADPGAALQAAGGAVSGAVEDIQSPGGAGAFARGVADITGLGGAAETLLQSGRGRTGREVDLRVEFEQAKRTLKHGKALAAGQLVGSLALAPSAARKQIVTAGGRAAEAARIAGLSGAASANIAASEGASPEDIVSAGLTGAAAPLAIGGAASGAAKLARPLITGPVRPVQTARRELGQVVQDPAALERRVAKLQARTGQAVSVAEALPQGEAARLGERMAIGSPRAVEVLQERAKRLAKERGPRLAKTIEKRGVASADDVRAVAQDDLTRLLRAEDKFGAKGQLLADKTVVLPNSTVQMLIESDMFRHLPDSVKNPVRRASEREGAARIPLGAAEEIRRTFGKSGLGGLKTENEQRFLRVSETVREVAGKQNKDYERGLRQFAQQQARADGIEEALGMSGKPIVDVKATIDTAKKEATSLKDPAARERAKARVAGLVEGTRSGLVQELSGQPAAAAGSLRETARSQARQVRLARVLGGKEAADTISRAKAELERGESLATVAASASAGAKQALRDANLIDRTVEGAIIAGGSASAAFKASFTERLLTLGIPEAAARKLSEMVVDPKQTPKLIAALKRRKVTDRAITGAFRQAGIASGVLEAGEE